MKIQVKQSYKGQNISSLYRFPFVYSKRPNICPAAYSTHSARPAHAHRVRLSRAYRSVCKCCTAGFLLSVSGRRVESIPAIHGQPCRYLFERVGVVLGVCCCTTFPGRRRSGKFLDTVLPNARSTCQYRQYARVFNPTTGNARFFNR